MAHPSPHCKLTMLFPKTNPRGERTTCFSAGEARSDGAQVAEREWGVRRRGEVRARTERAVIFRRERPAMPAMATALQGALPRALPSPSTAQQASSWPRRGTYGRDENAECHPRGLFLHPRGARAPAPPLAYPSPCPWTRRCQHSAVQPVHSPRTARAAH